MVKDPETPKKEARKYRLLLPLGCGCAVKFSVSDCPQRPFVSSFSVRQISQSQETGPVRETLKKKQVSFSVLMWSPTTR